MKKLLVQIIKDNGSPMTRTMIIKKLIDMEKPSGNVYRDVAKLVKNRNLENINGWYTVVPDIPDLTDIFMSSLSLMSGVFI